MTLWGTVTALQTLPTLGSDPVPLQVDLGGEPVTDGTSLSDGIRMLYQKCQFYDVLLVAGGKRFPAHKAVLAALSTSFCEHMCQATQTSSPSADCSASSSSTPTSAPEDADFEEHPSKDAFHGEDAERMPADDLAACKRHCRERGHGAFVVWRGTAYFRSRPAADCTAALRDSAECTAYVDRAPEVPAADVDAPPLDAAVQPTDPHEPARRHPELHLQGVACAEAVAALLDFAYGLGCEYSVSSHEANRDVLRLAKRFGLPRLQELATHKLAEGLSTENALERLATCEEFGLAPVYDLIIEQITQSPQVLLVISNDLEVMKHPKILQSLLVQAAAIHGADASKTRPKRGAAPAPREKWSEKRRKVMEEAAGAGGA
mmetsp:Transcript_91281/g.242463  ORF Transcript_91281/g.242463 Transcript_91281/m.242463 type:complete len:375 (-) Transcript_91281:67-1191(-)|eukprot:CAMPEP_0171194298 /NCGR_PEP_ID=MMETSP0790-20130122/20820_1 /TAXON_ID=2925 /ORGANISM="Alexandrium catenella, Strain OF101" /LENGTH=374 /DNA_ID=CAMNT_0011659497 /DNA_START=45 /DNA_END=1169 /DNA_ORIENTATION=-